ncbi:POK18 protein, partial [Aleadryas rufinucha]|nr:POK18 protein [Aleadryas rufinucha]
SLTICQWYVANIPSPIQNLFPDAIIHHYMDDILTCASEKTYLDMTVKRTVEAIEEAGFEIHEDKVQYTSPWTYLGFQIRERTIAPQQLAIQDDPETLRNLDKLCGSINWVHSLLGITTEDLVPLFSLLCSGEDLDSPRTLTPEARDFITKVQETPSSHQAHRVKPSLPLQF